MTPNNLCSFNSACFFFPVKENFFRKSSYEHESKFCCNFVPGKGLEQINSKIHSCWRHFLEKRSDKIVNVRLYMEREEYSVEGA